MKKIGIYLVMSVLMNNMIAQTEQSSSNRLYANLLKKILINSIYQDPSFHVPRRGIHPYDVFERENGRDWPTVAHTMIGLKRLNNIEYCVEDVIAHGVPGDFVETGVWRGGACILMRGLLEVHNDRLRHVWVCDSFCGLPKPNIDEFSADDGLNIYERNDFLGITLETVQENFRRYDLLDDQVKFLKGWFKDTLPTAPMEKIAILRLDGDMYESTWQALTALYPKVSKGGYVIIDDYQIPQCVKAVQDYRALHHIDSPIIDIDGFGVFWQVS